MGEHGLGDERLAQLDELRAGICGYLRGFIRVCGRVFRPALFGDFVGVDEDAARQQRRQREFYEGRLARTVGPDDEIEPLHRLRAGLAFRRRFVRRTSEVPSGRCSTMSPSSLSATVVTPRRAST